VNYVSRLRQLTHKDAVFQLTEVHDEAFDTLKQAVCESPVLRYFDPESEVTLQTDSSEAGLALLQKRQPKHMQAVV
jgi:hypothetical protein